MKKFAILAGLMALAVIIGVVGSTFRAGRAEARPTDVISFSPSVCAFLASDGDWDAPVPGAVDMDGDGDIGAPDNAMWVCNQLQSPPYPPGSGLTHQANLAALADALGGEVNDPDTYADLVDATAAQLGEDDGFGQTLWVVTFVTNDDNLALDADEGIWLSTVVAVPPPPPSSETQCVPAVVVGIVDEDCDDDGDADGVDNVADTIDDPDGVVVDLLLGDGADRGDAIVTATQAGIDVELDYTVVGLPDDMSLSATKTTLQEGAADADCDLGDFADAIAKAPITGLLAEVVDEDGTALTGIRVAWDSSDDDVLHFALVQEDDELTGADEVGDVVNFSTTISAISSGGTVATRNLGCGVDLGDVTVTAWVMGEINLDTEIDLTVVGAPASMTLAANPPSVACNGVNNSEVSATLLDSAGAPVVAGNSVRFEVVALGISDPIIADTDENGVAKSKITPLSGVTSGVTVLVSVVDDDSIEGNILVACTPGPGTIPGPVTPAVVPPVTPPRTGDGGYLP